ncbi:Splicing factor 3B subunit 6-like protein (Pre-mRNA branch site p14-like protein) [Durusdinium trenchii]|uniref:Splicing factor 3B subunit 6-like protein (Pre-mRNA branch site p14-like protein) n=1 Tax=Durusdinium trenchii TaxID=1381693 RepID=A0ABP0HXU3_9DINO
MSTSAGGAASVAGSVAQTGKRLAPEVNRILYVKNLPFKITGEELYEIFGKFGAIRQVRLGTSKKTRGTAFLVFEDILDAKNCVESMTGFKVGSQYVVVLYYKPKKIETVLQDEHARKEVEALKRKHKVALE